MTTARWLREADMRGLRDRIAADPAWFFREVLGARLYAKQVEIVEAVRDHPRVSVAASNATGKDFVSGRLVLWWLLSRYPAKVVIVGPTHRQVAEIVWRETRTAYASARMRLGGRMLSTPNWEIDDQHFALGFTSDDPMNYQGFHSPSLLVIVTEAHAVEQPVIDSLNRLLPKRFLMTGNTLVAGGTFWETHHTKRDLWRTVTINAFDTPNVREGRIVVPGLVDPEWIVDRKADWGEDSAIYQAAVLGRFPEDLEGTVVPLRYAVEASQRTVRRDWLDTTIPESVRPSKPPVMIACDVARSGEDKTVVIRRQGPDCTILHRAQGHDLMQTAGVLKGIWDEQKPDALIIDAVGLGAGVVDRLRELGVRAQAFNGGEPAADPNRYANRNAEVWWAMREWFLAGPFACIPNDPPLIGQVSGRRYEIMSDRKVKLESKDEMKARGVRSPDEADALAMTFWRARSPKMWM